MIRRIVALSAFAVLVSCATAKNQEHQTKMEQQRITNLTYFDVAACNPPTLELPDKVTSEVVLGVLLHARAQVMECLVDPKSRGQDKTTTVVLDSTLNATGVDNKVSGTNLTADGEKCIKDSLDKWMATMPKLNEKNAFAPPPAKGEAPKPVSGHVEIQHLAGVSPTVNLGVNEGSDYVGAIRLGEATWCDCYAPWKDAPPHSLTALIELARPAPAKDEKKDKKDEAPAVPATVKPSKIEFVPTNDPTADKVAACMKEKLMAMDFKTPAGEFFRLPTFPFKFVHSRVKDPIPNATPDIAFTQFDLLRGTRTADAAIAYGPRTFAVTAYDEAVKTYKEQAAGGKRPKGSKPVTVKELKDKCAELLKADDGITAALGAQLAVDQATHDFIAAQLAKDPQWAEAEAASAQKVASTQKAVEDSKKTREQDQGACPREHY